MTLRILKRIAFISFFLFTITSCTTITPTSQKALPLPTKSWSDRKESLSRIHNWQLSGKIAVQTAKDSGSATIDWEQHQNQYSISLLGPLGSASFKLTGQHGSVSLQTNDGKHFTANSPEQLLAQHYGWNLPVSNLNYWIRGLPVPNVSADTRFDANNRLIQLAQQGWDVQFLSYMNAGKVELPSKIFITSAALKTRIVIYTWNILNN